MEVRIGIKGAPRELVLDSAQSGDDIQKAVDAALKNESPTVTLTDDKGRRRDRRTNGSIIDQLDAGLKAAAQEGIGRAAHAQIFLARRL